MGKNVPFLLILGSILLPALLAHRPAPKRSIRLLHGLMAALILVWGYLCLNVYPLYVFIE